MGRSRQISWYVRAAAQSHHLLGEHDRRDVVGGAVGDALGAPVEFMRLDEIRQQFGPSGIRDYAPTFGRLGAITDDTQMTLFTAEGLLRGDVRGSLKGITHYPSMVHSAYLRWLMTQGDVPEGLRVVDDGWLITHRELFSRRAPGATCLDALRTVGRNAKRAPNDSKGCGAVMRIAPVGMFGAIYGADPKSVFDLAAEIAWLTHGHVTARTSAGVVAVIVAQLVEGASLPDALTNAKQDLVRHRGHRETLAAIAEAERLAGEKPNDPKAIGRLGGGWVSEEALAIALYCALSATNFESGVVLAVNHDGDSDSTGSITGNILGALFGAEAIPSRWLASLELREVIEAIADDLAMLRQWRIDGHSDPQDRDRMEAWYPGW